MNISELTIQTFENSMFVKGLTENAYLIHKRGNRRCVIVDPGMNSEPMVDTILNNGWTPEGILLTHGHYDHFAGIPVLHRSWPQTPVYIGDRDASKLTDPETNQSKNFGYSVTVSPADVLIHDEESFYAGEILFKSIRIPGHTDGHVVYLIQTDEGYIALVGDVIFAGSIGIMSLDSDMTTLMLGIEKKLLPLPDKTLLLPGHGKKTDLLTEKQTNPWLKYSFIDRGAVHKEFHEKRRARKQKLPETADSNIK